MLKPKNHSGCPYLMLAPMEGVGDASFRKAIASIGGFDEAIRDFLRVPRNAHVQSLATVYDPDELSPIPLAAQIMGGEVELMCAMAQELQRRGALHINVNCGCPSNTVTGRGAGSSLLKEPNFLHEIVKNVVQSVSIPVSVKMRSGYHDISLFHENLQAVESSGAAYVIIHPRTKVDGYGPPAVWELIAQAKATLKIPVVGNGDILNVKDALRMLKETCCDALMIGRGSIINPFIFHEIRAHFEGRVYQPSWDSLQQYLKIFLLSLADAPLKTQVNKLKQLLGFLFKRNSDLEQNRNSVLTFQASNPAELLQFILPMLQNEFTF